MEKTTISTSESELSPMELEQCALEHCVFALKPRAETLRDGLPIFVQASGVRLRDAQGQHYLDMLSSNTRACSLGYGSEEVARAMYEQALTLHYAGTVDSTSIPMIRLASTLARLAPGRLSHVAFASGGSEAVETALKLAKQYQQQSGLKPRAYKTISRWNAYHGATMGALAVTDWLAVRDIEDPRVPGHSFVANPMRYRNPYGIEDELYADLCVKHLERQILLEGPDQVAAFIGEGIMQANGVQIPVDSYWPRVRDICTKYGVVLIVDEVISGFGRAGHWFACDHFQIVPDMITMAKAMSAGYAPLGAVITTSEIAEAVDHFRHVHTYAGHAVACAACNAVIAIKEREGLIERARKRGPEIADRLRIAVGDSPIVGQIRGLGHWHAVDFTSDRATRAPLDGELVKDVARRMRNRGVIASAIGTAIEIAPPLIISDTELDEGIEALARAVYEVERT